MEEGQKDLGAQLAQAQARIASLEAELGSSKASVNGLNSQIAELRKSLGESQKVYQQALTDKGSEIQALKSEWAKKESDLITDWQSKLSEAQAQVTDLQDAPKWAEALKGHKVPDWAHEDLVQRYKAQRGGEDGEKDADKFFSHLVSNDIYLKNVIGSTERVQVPASSGNASNAVNHMTPTANDKPAPGFSLGSLFGITPRTETQ